MFAGPCNDLRRPRLACRWPAGHKASWPAGHLYASASPGPPQLSSPLYKQLRKTAGQSCRTSTNGQFFARSSFPCKPCRKRKTAQGKASWPAGHLRASASREPGPPQLSSPLYKQLRKTAGQSCRTSTNGQFFARSSPLQAVSQEKDKPDSAGQSFVARGPPACFAQPRAASAKLAPIQAAYMRSCASARTSCVARGRKRLRRAKLRGPRAIPACFGQPRARAASAKLAPIQAASQDSRAKLSHKH